MLAIRSIAFNIAFIIVTLLEMIIFAPIYFFLPRKLAWFVPKFWGKTAVFLLRIIANIKMEVTGLENIEKIANMSKSYIIAPKHQSAWETMAIVQFFDDPSYILKRELMWIPFFGWYMAKTGMIPINRGSPVQALKKLITNAREKVKQGRQILIFPEGTRSCPGAKPQYKAGIASIYKELNIPVLPIAHDAGLYWPRSNWRRYPGTIRVEILPPIEAGLDKKNFMKKLEDEIETRQDARLRELEEQVQAGAIRSFATLDKAIERLDNRSN